jgi:hypothetical protein
MGDTSRALQTISEQLSRATTAAERREIQDAVIPMYAIGNIGISRGEMVFECRYDRTRDPPSGFLSPQRKISPFAIGVTSKYFRGPSRKCPAYLYRADGAIVASLDEERGQPYGERLVSGCTVTVHLNLSRGELSFYVDGRGQGVAFVFSPVDDPEPLFPLVIFERDGDTGSILPPRRNIVPLLSTH